MASGFNIPSNFTPSLSYIADQEGLDEDLFEKLIRQESGFNPSAISSAGAIGLGQLMPGTASDLGVDPYDPIENMFGSARYLKNQIDDFGSTELGLAAYNAGPDRVRQAGGIPNILETQKYVANITGKPLPNVPDFSPSKYADIELESAALPSSSRRERDLSRVSQEITGLESLKDESLKALGTEHNLDTNDAIAVALTAILPTLLGLGFGGGLQGAAMGAQAGAAGANVGLAGLTAEQKDRNATSKLLYEDAKQRIIAKEAEAKGIRDSIADNEFQTSRDQATDRRQQQRDERLYGEGGFRMAGQANKAKQREPLSEATVQELARQTGRPIEVIKAMSQEDPYRLDTLTRNLGANVKPVDADTRQVLSSAEELKQAISSARKLASEFEPGLAASFKSGRMTDYYSDPDSSAYKYDAEMKRIQKVVARLYDKGALSAADVDTFKPLTTGNLYYDSKDSIAERLNNLETMASNRLSNVLDIGGKTNLNVSQLGNSSPSAGSTSNTTGVPSEGQMFNGQRVKAVKRLS